MTVRRGIMPGNFANPNLILQRPDGMRIGMGDDRSPLVGGTGAITGQRHRGCGAANLQEQSCRPGNGWSIAIERRL
jgi:hypothetical protein